LPISALQHPAEGLFKYKYLISSGIIHFKEFLLYLKKGIYSPFVILLICDKIAMYKSFLLTFGGHLQYYYQSSSCENRLTWWCLLDDVRTFFEQNPEDFAE